MKKRISVLLVLVMLFSLLAGCSSKPSSKPASDKIKIGLDYELSGQVATYGQSLVSGIELATEEINKNGGVLNKQIELVKVDNKSDSAEAANAATKLVNDDKVIAILGPATSGDTKAAAPIAGQNKVPLISASATADDVTVDSTGKVREYVFKTCFSDFFQGVIMANYAFTDLKTTKAAILIDRTSDYSKGLATNFKATYTKLGGSVVTEQGYQEGDKDFRAVLTNIKSTNPDIIYLPGYYSEAGLIVKQARGLGLNVPICGGDGYDSPKLLELAGSTALNNVYFTNHYSSSDNSPDVVKFQTAYKAKYGKDPDAFAALGYDLAYFMADGLKRAGAVDSVKLKDALASTKDFQGITGKLSIDSKHNPVKSITILEEKNGVQTFVKKQEP